MDTPEIREYVAQRPFYTPVLIPKDTYAGQDANVRTFGVLATLVATTDTPEIAAYSVVRAVFEGLAELKAMQPALRNVVPEAMIKDGLSAPLHSGAVRYYRERGWIKTEMKSASLTTAADALAAAAATPPAAIAPTSEASPAPQSKPVHVLTQPPAPRSKNVRGKPQQKRQARS